MMLRGLLAAGALALALPAVAEEGMTAQQFVDQLHFRDGHIEVAEAKAHFDLGPQFRWLDQADARAVLEQLWGNPEDDSVLGLVVPAKVPLQDSSAWAVVVTYSDDGYVSDKDAAGIDYADLLKQMQQDTRERNAERSKAGYPTADLLGWAATPHYDAASKKLYWAKELAFQGEPAHTLNYDIRVLGRHGFLSLMAVSGMNELPQVETGMQALLPMADFDSGARYADHNPSTDKVAAYGVAALIGGGLAAKAGLFAKLGLILAKFWKLGLIAVAAGGAAVRKLFAGRRERDSRTVR